MDFSSIQIKFSPAGMLLLNIILAVILYGIAVQIKREEILSVRKNWKSTLVGMFSQIVALPFITWLLILAIKPNPHIAMGMIIVAACPGGNISNFITFIAKGNVVLSVSLTGISVLLSVLITPFNISFYGNLYPPVAALLNTIEMGVGDMLQTFFLLLILPVFLGLFTQYKFPNFAQKVANVIKKISMLLLIAFIVGAFASNAKVFIDNVSLVFSLVLLQNTLAFFTGFSLSKLFRLSWKDVKTITIETGIHNAGLGLILIFNFFDGNGGAALVAALWGVWHLLSGFVIAKIFSRID